MSAVKPALTEQEWASTTVERGHILIESYGECLDIESDDQDSPGAFGIGTSDTEARHALAALCLHGQPFGFTREDVVRLRSNATAFAGNGHRGLDQAARHFTNLADRIEALLPPEG